MSAFEGEADVVAAPTIGFLGTKQHRVLEEGAGFETKWRQDLTKSSDGHYRPVDIEVAPDGSLYITDDRGGTIWRVFRP